jgi:hypothetical protein
MVVLPVPTSPVSKMRPLRAWIPYVSSSNDSCVCGVKNRYRGSGLILNGFSHSAKKCLYMLARSVELRIVYRVDLSTGPRATIN